MDEFGGKILIADDEMTMRDALELTLGRMGFAVDVAANGMEASKMLLPGRYQMLVTDVKMPKMNGIDLLKIARESCPQMPVLVITGYGTITNAVEAMKYGASDYIVKPFPAETLEDAIRKNLLPPTETLVQNIGQDDRAIITQDANVLKILKIAKNISNSDATVLINGESGTGKELLARYIHRNSPRSGEAFVAFNCAAMPESLMESELFGHEKGSFTGAIGNRKGKFELAHKGTILLDEISEMDVNLQAKLLRVIQEKEIDKVGGEKPVQVDVRIIATTNADIRELILQGKFREDLYFRLAVIPLTLPPLRDRPKDVEILVDHFASIFSAKHGKNIQSISKPTLDLMSRYEWKGNIRELSNTMERAILLCEGTEIIPQNLFLEENTIKSNSSMPFMPGISLREMERELILATLEDHGQNRTKAADTLGISIRTLRNKLKEYGLSQNPTKINKEEITAGSGRQDIGSL